MIIYVSIPITGTNIEETKKKAESVKFMLYGRFVGSKVITPFDVCKEKGKSYAYYMGKDVKALLESDKSFSARAGFSKRAISICSSRISISLLTNSSS